MPENCPRTEFNVDPRLIFPGPVRLSSTTQLLERTSSKGRGGRRPGHAVSREVTIRMINTALERRRPGPIYKWWAARVLGVSVPTLYTMLKDYGLQWPPPWPTPPDSGGAQR